MISQLIFLIIGLAGGFVLGGYFIISTERHFENLTHHMDWETPTQNEIDEQLGLKP